MKGRSKDIEFYRKTMLKLQEEKALLQQKLDVLEEQLRTQNDFFCSQIDISMLRHRGQCHPQVYELRNSYTIDGPLLFPQENLHLAKTYCIFAGISINVDYMEVKKIKYPVGYQDFGEIHKGGFLYIDKTELIYNLVDSSKYVFLSRPRRFGKTLLTSTLHYYLSGRKDLFTGLAIEKLEKDWIQYPVLHFDLSRLKELTVEELREELHEMLNKYDKTFGIKTTGTPGSRLDKLIQGAYEQTGQQVVVLIDEYDAPIMDALHEPDKLLEVRKVMRNFYTSLKANDSCLKFVFITGVSTFSQMGIFSELNNLNKITNDDSYAAICGITEQELKDNFKTGIKSLAEVEECTPEEMLERLKDKYNDYHFSDALVDIYTQCI
jgi:hypothetical protein